MGYGKRNFGLKSPHDLEKLQAMRYEGAEKEKKFKNSLRDIRALSRKLKMALQEGEQHADGQGKESEK